MKFEDSQPEIWDRLSRAKKNNRIGTAYLFSGQRGSGKEWAAIEFAKLLNCIEDGLVCCNNCEACVKFKSLQHPNLKIVVPLPSSATSNKKDDPLIMLKKEDFQLLTDSFILKGRDPFHKISLPNARRITINSIRDLRKSIYLKSYSKGRKIILIFDAHLLSEGGGESANALLKILEEPPPKTSIFLISDNFSALPLTIISRCQNINFPNLELNQVRLILENKKFDNEKSSKLAMISGGDVHLALHLANQKNIDPLVQVESAGKAIIQLSKESWKSFVDQHSMLAFRNPNEFKFKIYLTQLWFQYSFQLRLEMSPPKFLDSRTIGSLNNFNNQYPHADLNSINESLEEAIISLSKNLYMPLVLTNLLISIQTFLKGKQQAELI